jgi:hypothetical protein
VATRKCIIHWYFYKPNVLWLSHTFFLLSWLWSKKPVKNQCLLTQKLHDEQLTIPYQPAWLIIGMQFECNRHTPGAYRWPFYTGDLVNDKLDDISVLLYCTVTIFIIFCIALHNLHLHYSRDWHFWFTSLAGEMVM